MNGKIIKCVSNDYTIRTTKGDIICKPRGIFRKKGIIPLVGDNVIINYDNKVIEEILNRKNKLIRPPVSNVDNAFIVTSVKEPDLNLNLLDKMINIIEFNNIKPIIIFTKLDLLNDKTEINNIISYYKKIGYVVLDNTKIEEIKLQFKNSLTILTGQTGAGKSTLLNKIDSSLNLKTNEISKSLGRGKHTTRVTQLYDLYDGLVADTPGFSALDFINMTEEDIKNNFIEFNKYKDKCEFKNCRHINEVNCEVKRQLEKGNILSTRYINYKKFIENR